MKQIAMQVEQALKRLRDHFEMIRNRLKEKNDDSVEAQAQTFRIWMWSSAAGLALIVIASVVATSRDSSDAQARFAAENPATEKSILDQLPDGYVLAPIEPTNLDSLDSILDQQGYADLYTASANGERGKRIAKGLPLIRAPRNPRRFAVIVSEAQTPILEAFNEPVLVILRKGPVKTDEIFSMKKSNKKTKRPRPIIAGEIGGKIDLIEEDLPAWNEVVETKSSGANL